jgi:P pilus assembly chaperone PapD
MRGAARVLVAAAFAMAAVPARAQPDPVPPAPTQAGAALNITPKRISFDAGRRNGSVFLLNQGTAPITVDIVLVDRVMLLDGHILSAAEAAEREDARPIADQLKSARDLLQVSPRRVTLQPGRGQTVRLRLSALPPGGGEHRSHLTVTTLPPRGAGQTADAAAGGQEATELRFQITALYGISIPVIVRTAQPDVGATIENVRLEFTDSEPDGRGRTAPPTPVLTLELVRLGASSLYGNFEVRGAGGRAAEPLGLARGVGLYPEIPRRKVRIPLSRAPAAGEKLDVSFTDDDTSPGRVLARAAL